MNAKKETTRLVDRGARMKDRGNPDAGFAASDKVVEGKYTIPIEHHNAMEPHGATAFWEGDKLTVFDKSQGVFGCRRYLAQSFGVPDKEVEDRVKVISTFVGGGFGSALLPHYYVYAAALGAKMVDRPVKVNYTRRQMFTGNGYRPFTYQEVKIGAKKDGKIQAIHHSSFGNTSTFENFSENSAGFGRTLYDVPNYKSEYSIVKTDLPTPTWKRAPGAVSGAFALESAIDELSYELGIDPLELRKINYAYKDPETGKPYSSKELMKCFEAGAKKFGWSKRKMKPRSMRDGDWLVGWGTGIGTWGAFQQTASVSIRLNEDGSAHVASGVTDIGPGTYTVITMIAAEYLGIDPDKIKFTLGDTRLPTAPSQGGSWTTASVGSAVYGAAKKIKSDLRDLAIQGAGTAIFGTASADDMVMLDGELRLKSDPSKKMAIPAILKMGGKSKHEVEYTSRPDFKKRGEYTTMAHGAQFVEVKVDEALGIVKVTRVIEATACGRIMNPKTSHSQEEGGIIGGIGMALFENTEIDHRYGKMMTTNFADYHIPSHADIHEVNADFVEEKDEIVNELGVKGMGELCMVGVPAAIANAIFHATGKRIQGFTDYGG